MSIDEEKKFVMKHTFIDVMNTENDTDLYGEKEKHFNIPWSISIYSEEYSSTVGVYFECGKKKKGGNDWLIDATILAKLFTKDGETCIERKDLFTNEDREEFKYLDELQPIDDYLVDGNLTVEYHVTIHKMIGIDEPIFRSFNDESAKELSDIVLKVKDQKFYVNKMYLAAQSTYFKSLFLGNFNESKQSEVELKDIDSYDFQKFLQVLYVKPDINDETVSGILKLADMYDSKVVIEQCESFLIKESTQNFKKKFLLATKYKLEDLKKKCMPEFKTSEDIAAVIPKDSAQFGTEIWKELLNLALDFNKKLSGK